MRKSDLLKKPTRCSAAALSLAILGLSAGSAVADEPEADASSGANPGADSVMEVITIVANRQPREVSDVAGTVTVIDQERMNRDLVIDPTDLVRYEPGVEIDHGGTRFGDGGFRIRGIGANRTAVVIDHIPVADRFSVGNFADSGRGLLDIGLTGSVEILRGPASTMYGSKALGGVVAIRLLDADDVLTNATQGSRLTLSGATDSNRARLTGVTAQRNGDWSWLLGYSGQVSGETKVKEIPQGTPNDEQDKLQQAALIRVARDTDIGRMRVTFDALRDEHETDIRAMTGSGRYVFSDLITGDDSRSQYRLVFDHDFGAGVIPGVFQGHWRTWYQDMDTQQDTVDYRPEAPAPVEVSRSFSYRQKQAGIGLDLESVVAGETTNQRAIVLGYGLELSQSEFTNERDASELNLNTGERTSVVLGEVFPLRDFPKTKVTELGVYASAEIKLWEKGPVLSPGVRYEYYDLNTQSDSLFDTRFPDANVTDLSTSEWLPRLGMVWPVTQDFELFAQYARGFRAPPFEDVNIGLHYPQFNVMAISNPDLKPEEGRSVELGTRWRNNDTRVELAVFRNDYKDFIETRAALGFDPVRGLMLFQSVNRDRVRIEGAELRVEHQFDREWRVDLGAEVVSGEDKETGRNIASVTPAKAVTGITWDPAWLDWEFRGVVNAIKGQRHLEDETGERLFSASGAVTFDAYARWFISSDIELGFGLRNLTDQVYWNNAAVSGRPADDPTLPLLAAPRRSVHVNLQWVF